MDSSFPSYDRYLIIDDSSSDEEDDEDDHPRPGTSRDGLPADEDVKNAVSDAITHFFNKNKYLFDHQVKLCDDYMTRGITQCLTDADAIDEVASQLENEMKLLREELYEPYQPIVTSLDPVEISDWEKVELDKENENIETPKEVQSPEEEIITDQEAKRLKLDKSDKEDVIAVNRTFFHIPSHVPDEGPLQYPLIHNGQTVYGMKLTLLQPWYKCKIKSSINNDYVHVKFDNDEKLVTTKEIAYCTLNPVRFPVGCRVIAKYTDPNTKQIEFYAGIIAEPPKMLNVFR